MANFCLIRPACDAYSLEVSAWCAGLSPAITEAGHSVTHDLCASGALRASVGPAMAAADCVLFFGHGTETELVGAGNMALVDSSNIDNASGAIFVAIACFSAQILGHRAIESGVEAYLGYSRQFLWLFGDPERVFQAATTSGILRLVHGESIDSARQTMRSGFGKIVDYYRSPSGRSRPNSTLGYLAAFWNQQHLELLGDLTATLSPTLTAPETPE